MNIYALAVLFALSIAPFRAYADCASPEGVQGEIIYNVDHSVFQGCTGNGWRALSGAGGVGNPTFGDDPGPCTPELSGGIKFVSTATPPWQFCDGANWVNFKQPQCADDATGECYLNATRSASDPNFTAGNIRGGVNILNVTGSLAVCTNDAVGECILGAARSASDAQFLAANIANGVNILGVTGALAGGLSGPAGCASIGALCADGTVFAGYDPITHQHLFIPTTDQGTTSRWKTSTGANDIATDSTYDGRVNTNQVANSTTFAAFKLCKDLTAGGHNDWYLPSQVELHYLWAVRPTIEAAGNITNFNTTTTYWSSTEYDTFTAFHKNFGTGVHSATAKNSSFRVRCVRR